MEMAIYSNEKTTNLNSLMSSYLKVTQTIPTLLINLIKNHFDNNRAVMQQKINIGDLKLLNEKCDGIYYKKRFKFEVDNCHCVKRTKKQPNIYFAENVQSH